MKAGDKVVYIRKSLPQIGLVNGETYIVLGASHCDCKDGLHINIGTMLPNGLTVSVCGECKSLVHEGANWYLHHTGFAPVNSPQAKYAVEHKKQNVL